MAVKNLEARAPVPVPPDSLCKRCAFIDQMLIWEQKISIRWSQIPEVEFLV